MKNEIRTVNKDTFKYFFVGAACLSLCILLTVYAPESKSGVSRALCICSQTVIPSLFPFMFLSDFIIECGLLSKNIRFLDRITKKLLRLPYCAVGVFLMSALGGFPVGGKMTKLLYERGEITENQAQRLLLFCVNPSLSFSAVFLGLSLFGNISLGFIIYFSVLLSNIIIAFLTRYLADSSEEVKSKNKKTDIASAFVRSGSECASSMISICTFVIVFACLESVLEAFIQSKAVIDFLSGTLEVTTGCQRLAVFSSAPLLSAVTAWGGISVHCQIADCIRKVRLNVKLYITSRIVSAGLSAVICDMLLKIFPEEINAVSVSLKLSGTVSETSFPISVAMLLTCCVFLAGDYSCNSRRKY